MGLNVHICRDAFCDPSENRLSQRFDSFCITNLSGPHDPTEKSPAAVLVRQETGNVVVVPQEMLDSRRWFTSGGNYAYTSDQRFTNAVEVMSGYPYAFPVAIHDSVE